MSAAALRSSRRREQLEAQLNEHLGLTLSAYTPTVIRGLLDHLPEHIDLSQPDQHAEVLQALAIHETYFLRHPEQFEILPALARQLAAGIGGRPLSVWSAACSTGEEVYSLAATLIPALGAVEILGTDLDRVSVERARRGRYRAWSLRGRALEDIPWLEAAGEDYQVLDRLRGAVRFEVLNLAEDRYPSPVDLILCRNVLIYFEREQIQEVFTRLLRAASPGGALLLANADPTPEAKTGWIREYYEGVRIYRKPERQASYVPQPLLRAARPEPAAPEPAAPEPAAPEPAAPEPAAPELAAPEALDRARSLAAEGLLERALSAARRAVDERPDDAERLLLASLIACAAGERGAALLFARRALMLDGEAPLPNALTGLLLSRERPTPYARRRLDKAAEVLRGMPRGADLGFGPALDRDQLLRAIRRGALPEDLSDVFSRR